MRLLLLIGRGQEEVVAHGVKGYIHFLTIGCYAGFVTLEARDEGTLHPKNGVRVEIPIILLEDVGDESLVTWHCDHEVNMRRAHWAAIRRSPAVLLLAHRPVWGRPLV